MHPAFIYVVHQVFEDERRRMSSHLPDPDPSEEFAPRPVVAAPQRSGRSPRARLAAVVAASRRRMSRDAGGSAA
jgi:hypothetical protein